MRKKVVLITGASSGIGYDTAKSLAGKGHKVYAAARRVELMEPLKASKCEAGPKMRLRHRVVEDYDLSFGRVSSSRQNKQACSALDFRNGDRPQV